MDSLAANRVCRGALSFVTPWLQTIYENFTVARLRLAATLIYFAPRRLHVFKTPIILSLAAAGMIATSAAHADQTTGWFVNGNVGTAHYKATANGLGSGTDSNTAFMLNAGWRDQGILGFEVGYTNLGSSSAKDNLGDSAKLRADGWNLGLNGHFNFNDHWYMSARTGGYLWKLKAKATINNGGISQTWHGSKQGLGWYAGVGTGYDINQHWSVGANFDYYKIRNHGGYDIGTRVFSVSGEYRF